MSLEFGPFIIQIKQFDVFFLMKYKIWQCSCSLASSPLSVWLKQCLICFSRLINSQESSWKSVTSNPSIVLGVSRKVTYCKLTSKSFFHCFFFFCILMTRLVFPCMIRFLHMLLKVLLLTNVPNQLLLMKRQSESEWRKNCIVLLPSAERFWSHCLFFVRISFVPCQQQILTFFYFKDSYSCRKLEASAIVTST